MLGTPACKTVSCGWFSEPATVQPKWRNFPKPVAVPNKLHTEKMMATVFESDVAAVMSLNAADHSLDTSRAKRCKISLGSDF